MKKGFAIGIIALFIVTAVSPMSVGFDAGESQLVETTPTAMGPMDSAWPMKCHDNRHTGRSPYSTADNPYDEIWRYELEHWVDCNPAIDSEGTIYFGDNWGKFIAMYPNGTVKWTYTLGGQMIGSSPAIAEDGTIYVGSWDDRLYAINPDGTVKWRFLAYDNIFSSPAIGEDGVIYFGTMGTGYNIYAVNPDGSKKWHYTTDYKITSDPAIGDDGAIYIGSQDDYLYAMNPNGTVKWRFKTGDNVMGPPSIADDGTIYVGSYDTYLYAIHPNGTMKWKYNTGYGIATNPSIAEDGTIYVGGDELFAVEPNGTLKWSNDFGGNRHIDASCPAISADGTIYIGVNRGETSGGEIIATNPDGTVKWRKWIGGLWTDSSPSIAKDGTVYIGASQGVGEGGYLYAFNRAELSADANGPHYGLINQPVQFNGTGVGGYRPYTWLWDFGDGNTSTKRNPTYTYTTPNNYTVTLTVTDDTGNTTDDTTWAWIQETNEPPDIPTVHGELNGKIKTDYPYEFMSADPEGLHIWYYIEWGDEDEEDWIGPLASGTEITVSHSWNKKNTYTIRAKVKDPYGDESEWGELKVTMPKTLHWWLERFPLLQRLLEWLLG